MISFLPSITPAIRAILHRAFYRFQIKMSIITIFSGLSKIMNDHQFQSDYYDKNFITSVGCSVDRPYQHGVRAMFKIGLLLLCLMLFLAQSTLSASQVSGEHARKLVAQTQTENSGATLVKDINLNTIHANPTQMITIGEFTYFTADGGTVGQELFRSDGTEAGTVLIKDINPGIESSSPNNLTAIGATLYFSADDGVNGIELWRSDGSASGTVRVKDINSGSSSSSPQNFAVMGNYLLLVQMTELWVKSCGAVMEPNLAQNWLKISNR